VAETRFLHFNGRDYVVCSIDLGDAESDDERAE